MNDGMPLKEKVGLLGEIYFDFSLFIGVSGIEVSQMVEYCDTLQPEREEQTENTNQT